MARIDLDKYEQQALQLLGKAMIKINAPQVINKAAVKLAGADYSNWVQDLATDYQKRGAYEAMQDVWNPILMNKRVAPYAEPIVSGARLARFAATNPEQHMEYQKLNPEEKPTGQYRYQFAIANKIASVSKRTKDFWGYLQSILKR